MALHGSPSPEALLDGVIATLRDRVAPEVSDPVVAEQLGFAIALLRYLRDHWETATSDLLLEIANLEALLSGEEKTPAEVRVIAGDDLTYSALVERATGLHDRLVKLAAELAESGDEERQRRVEAALAAANERRR